MLTRSEITLPRLCALCLATGSLAVHADVVINEIDLANNKVELINTGDMDVDFTGWWWCNRVNGSPFYDQVTTVSGVDIALSSPGASTLDFLPGQTLVLDIPASFLPDANGELGLYETNSFASSTAIEDYAAWGGDGIRDSVANPTYWITGTFIDVSTIGAGETLQAVPGTSGIGPTEWLIGAGTLGAENIGGSIAGDYNDSGQVEQGDLDLVLQNWGVDTTGANIPAGWVNDLPQGQIEQTELDGVLQNWGNTAAPDFSGGSVPEPASAVGLLGGVGLLARRGR